MSRARKGMDLSKDPDPELGAELRQTAGREWAEEAAEDERLTELLRKRRLELRDVARDWIHKGDRVSAGFDGHNFSGAVVAAGDDYATLKESGQFADVLLGVASWNVLTRGEPVEPTGDAAGSFRRLLHEHASGEVKVRLALPGGELVIGTIAVVAVDHLEIVDVDDRHIYIPNGLVLATIRSTESH